MNGELKEFAHQLRQLCPSDVDDYNKIHFDISVIATDMETMGNTTPAPGALPELPAIPESLMATLQDAMNQYTHTGGCDIDAVIAAISAYAEQCRAGVWLPIESAPKDGSHVIAWFGNSKHGGYAESVYFSGEHWHWTHDGDSPNVPPTHWMPLPAPPALQSAFADDEGGK